MTKAKKLSLTAVHKQHSANFGEMRRVTLSNGDYVDVHVRFKPSDCQRLIMDYQDTLQRMQHAGVDWKSTREVLFVYYMMLLKYFTSLGDMIPSEIEQLVSVCGKLLDLGLMEEILAAFPETEMNKLNSYMEKANRNLSALEEQFKESKLASDGVKAVESE